MTKIKQEIDILNDMDVQICLWETEVAGIESAAKLIRGKIAKLNKDRKEIQARLGHMSGPHAQGQDCPFPYESHLSS